MSAHDEIQECSHRNTKKFVTINLRDFDKFS